MHNDSICLGRALGKMNFNFTINCYDELGKCLEMDVILRFKVWQYITQSGLIHKINGEYFQWPL